MMMIPAGSLETHDAIMALNWRLSGWFINQAINPLDRPTHLDV
jgi:hypothetical protein